MRGRVKRAQEYQPPWLVSWTIRELLSFTFPGKLLHPDCGRGPCPQCCHLFSSLGTGSTRLELPWNPQPSFGFVSLGHGFSNLALLTFWAGWFTVVKGCPVHCRVSDNIPGLYPLDASGTLPQIMGIKNVSRHLPWRQTSPNTGLGKCPQSFSSLNTLMITEWNPRNENFINDFCTGLTGRHLSNLYLLPTCICYWQKVRFYLNQWAGPPFFPLLSSFSSSWAFICLLIFQFLISYWHMSFV